MFNLKNYSTQIKNPTGIHIENQLPDEHIVLLLRRHFITNLGWILLTLLLLTIPFLLNPVQVFLQIDVVSQVPVNLRIVILSFYYLIVFGYAFEQFLLWYFSINVITNKRLVDVDFLGLLYKEVNDTYLENVQDVSTVVSGGFEVSFNFGDLMVQTEGPEANIVFEKIPNPGQVQDVITGLVAEARKNGTD